MMTGLIKMAHGDVQQSDCTILSCELTRQIDAFETLALVNPQLNPEFLVQNLRGILADVSSEVKSESDLNHPENCSLVSAILPVSSYDQKPELGQNDLHELRSFEDVNDLVLFNGDDHQLTSMTTMTNFYLVEDDIKPNMGDGTTTIYTDNLGQPSTSSWTTATTNATVSTIPKSSPEIVQQINSVNNQETSSFLNNIIINNVSVQPQQQQQQQTPPQNTQKKQTNNKRKSKSQSKPNTNWKKSKINLEPASNGSDDGNLLTPDKLKEADQYISTSRVWKGHRFINVFECQICHQSLTFSRNARLHVRRVHFNDRLQCSVCMEKFYDYKTLRIHIAKNHGQSVKAVKSTTPKNTSNTTTPTRAKKSRATKIKQEPTVVSTPTPIVVAPVSYSDSSASGFASINQDETQEPWSNYTGNNNMNYIIQPSPNLVVRNPSENFDLFKALNVRVLIEPLILPSSSSPTTTTTTTNSFTNFTNSTSKSIPTAKRTRQNKKMTREPQSQSLQSWSFNSNSDPISLNMENQIENETITTATTTTNSSSSDSLNFNSSSLSAFVVENPSTMFSSPHFQIIISSNGSSNNNMSTSTTTNSMTNSVSISNSLTSIATSSTFSNCSNYDNYDNIYTTTVEPSTSGASSEFPTVDLDVLRALCM